MRSFSALILASALAVAACSSSTGDSGGASAGSEPWRTATLRDVVSGDEFRIQDLEGKVVAIEAMAIWCTTCQIQQREAQAALETVNSPDVVYLSLDVDPNERAEDLADYARHQGFPWRFAVAPPEVSRSLAATFGDQVLSPPATPVVLLGPDGSVIEMHTGIKSAADLADLIEANLP
jgi:thiol-disulfide isomerase/thioredoxin